MSRSRGLFDLLADAAARAPHHTAVEEADGDERGISYAEMVALALRFRDWLVAAGVGPGDRVGIHQPKSIDSVASLFGALACGAAYVPLDPLAPAGRNAYILHNCQVKAVVAEQRLADAVQPELAKLGASPAWLELEPVGGGRALDAALARAAASALNAPPATIAPDDLAYLLYTSGSTGVPKGVMLSHRNALEFVDWCSSVFEPTAADRFSSHAPFHFDLSILDIYVPLKHGATLVLFGESLGKEPPRLAEKIAERRITNWYSAPSILSMLAQQGRLERHDWSALRQVLFAGEVFPVKHLRAIKAAWPAPRYFNLYGPTETNVCTWFEIPAEIPADRDEPYPIGRTCAHYRDRVTDADGLEVPPGDEGELCISGPGVMQGYWNLPELNARVFLDADGARWYRTGDVVARDAAGDYRFLGRKDRMIKKRGYRVELGEIEAALYRSPDIREAAVIAESNDDGVRVRAFLSTKTGQRLSLIALKQFCASQLPLYMIPDAFTFLDALPKTSTDKIDYQSLKGIP
jgi:amino acid adenylation domain-containing protein